MERLDDTGVESGPHIGEKGAFPGQTDVGGDRRSLQETSRGLDGVPPGDVQFPCEDVGAPEGNDSHGNVFVVQKPPDDFAKGSISPDGKDRVEIAGLFLRDVGRVTGSRREANSNLVAVPLESVAEAGRRPLPLVSARLGIGDDE